MTSGDFQRREMKRPAKEMRWLFPLSAVVMLGLLVAALVVL